MKDGNSIAVRLKTLLTSIENACMGFPILLLLALKHTPRLWFVCLFVLRLGLHSGSRCPRTHHIVQAGLRVMPQPPKCHAWLEILSLNEKILAAPS